jgi:hypothetical protein
MKLNRRKKVVLLLVGLAACAVGYFAVTRTLSVSTTDAARITVGMPKAEVEAILGPAPNDPTWSWSWDSSTWDRWQVTDGYIHVGFGIDQRVTEVKAEYVPIWQRLYDKALRKRGWRAGPQSSY